MGYEIPIIAGYTTFFLVIFAAWVGGYLDPLQHSLQDAILGKMGDNRASSGVKSELTRSLMPENSFFLLTCIEGALSQRVTDDKNANAAQDQAAQNVGGQVGKGGAGQGVGDTLSKGL